MNIQKIKELEYNFKNEYLKVVKEDKEISLEIKMNEFYQKIPLYTLTDIELEQYDKINISEKKLKNINILNYLTV